jgi:secondary thiamine-phosphate synthase enzyme
VAIRSESREFETTGDTDIIDLTGVTQEFVRSCGVREGLLVVFTPGSTAGITTIEYESGAIADLKRALEIMAPRHGEYEHNIRWGDGNGYSHVRSALIGPSLAVPVRDGRLELGTWQQIVLCDFDNRPRRRRVTLQLVGA